MRKRSVRLFTSFAPGLLLLTTIQIALAQQPSGSAPRNRATDERCRTPITVTGAVLAPTRIELRRHGRINLNEVVTLAGGFSGRAGETVEIRRGGLNLDCGGRAPMDVKKEPGSVEVYKIGELISSVPGANPFVHPGDKVTVSEVGIAYVTGNVVNPQPIVLREPTTVTQAIKLAGGFRPGSRTDQVRLYRDNDTAKGTMIVVDLRAVKKDHRKDIVLRAYDIVEVSGKRERHGGPNVFTKRLSSPAPELPLRIIH